MSRLRNIRPGQLTRRQTEHLESIGVKPKPILPRGLRGALKALKRIEDDQRLDPKASNERKFVVEECRRVIAEVMEHPKRYSQARLSAAAMLLDEMCGKQTQKTEESGEKTVNVVIRQGRNTEPL